MRKHVLLPVLLLTAAFPLAAVAQDTTTTPGATQTQPADDMNSTTGGTGTSDSGASPTQQDTTTPAATPTPPAGTDSAASPSGAMPTDQSASATGDTFVTVPETGAWRVSDLQGKTVYGSDGANIGEINDVLVSQDGSINAVIIGVGGFLGIGEKDVAVNMTALQLGPGDTQAQADAAMKALPNDATGATGAVGDAGTTTGTMGSAAGTDTAATSGAAGTAGSGTTGDMAANNSGASIGDDSLPDRIILNVTREQLEQAPAFEGVRAQQTNP